MGCLYLLEAPSGKLYIGITSRTAFARFEEHCSDARCSSTKKYLIHKAILCYGPASFKVTTLIESDDWQHLQSLEIEAVKNYKTLAPNGYNLTTGGDGRGGMPLSSETIEKIRKANTGKVRTQAVIEATRLRALGKKCSDEAKLKISQALKGRPGRKPTIETIMKIKAKRALQIIGPKSEETKFKTSIAIKEHWKTRK